MNAAQQSIDLLRTGAFKDWEKVDLLLDAVRQATEHADNDCGDVARTSYWLMLIEASVSHAQRLLHEMVDNAYAELSAHDAAQHQSKGNES